MSACALAAGHLQWPGAAAPQQQSVPQRHISRRGDFGGHCVGAGQSYWRRAGGGRRGVCVRRTELPGKDETGTWSNHAPAQDRPAFAAAWWTSCLFVCLFRGSAHAHQQMSRSPQRVLYCNSHLSYSTSLLITYTGEPAVILHHQLGRSVHLEVRQCIASGERRYPYLPIIVGRHLHSVRQHNLLRSHRTTCLVWDSLASMLPYLEPSNHLSRRICTHVLLSATQPFLWLTGWHVRLANHPKAPLQPYISLTRTCAHVF